MSDRADSFANLPVSLNALMESKPEPGAYFKRRLVRKGPWVPCRLWFTVDERDSLIISYHAEVNGEVVDAYDPPGWPWVRSDEAQFNYLTQCIAWAKLHAPDDMYANLMVPISASKIPLSPTRKK